MPVAFMWTETDGTSRWTIKHPALPDYLQISPSNPDQLSPRNCRLYLKGTEFDAELDAEPYDCGMQTEYGPFQRSIIKCLQSLGLHWYDACRLSALWDIQARCLQEREDEEERETDRLLAAGCCNDILDGVLK